MHLLNQTLFTFLICCCLAISCHAYSCHVGYDKLGNYYGASQSCPSGFVCFKYDILNQPMTGERIYGFTPTSNCESWKSNPSAYPNLVCCSSDLCNNKNAVAGVTSTPGGVIVDGNGTRYSMGISDRGNGDGLVQFILVFMFILTCFVL